MKTMDITVSSKGGIQTHYQILKLQKNQIPQRTAMAWEEAHTLLLQENKVMTKPLACKSSCKSLKTYIKGILNGELRFLKYVFIFLNLCLDMLLLDVSQHLALSLSFYHLI